MDENKYKAVTDALADLIRSELDNGRFACVSCLAEIGLRLDDMAPRPGQALPEIDDAMPMPPPNGGGMPNPVDRPVLRQSRRKREIDKDDAVIRETIDSALTAVGPMLEGAAQHSAAQQRMLAAQELHCLIDAREHLKQGVKPDQTEIAKITRKIEALFGPAPDLRAVTDIGQGFDLRAGQRVAVSEGDQGETDHADLADHNDAAL